MTRNLKQFIYGLFYLALIAFFIFLFTLFISKDKPCIDCFDNQIIPIKTTDNIKKINFKSINFAFVSLENPNKNYNADYSYKLTFIDKSEKKINEKYGSSFILASEKDYLLIPSESSFDKASLEITGINWNKVNENEFPFYKPKIENVSMSILDNGLSVKGVLVNNSKNKYSGVNIIILFKDRFGFNSLAVSQLLVNDLEPLSRNEFSVNTEISQEIKNKINIDNTNIFLSLKK